MKPFFFGDAGSQLLGVHHEPLRRPVRDIGIVLCYPMPHDYMGMHRAYRVLADRLAKVGFHVLRFDYYGTGDSAGDGADADLKRWMLDTHSAVQELKGSHGLLRFGLVGFRVGATLGALVACDRGDVEAVVLCDPIVRGDEYLEALRSIHGSWREAEVNVRPGASELDGGNEVLGTQLSDAMIRSLEGVALDRAEEVPARNVLLLSSVAGDGSSSLAEGWSAKGAAVKLETVPVGPAASDHSWVSLANVPTRTNHEIVTWLSEVAA